MSRLLLGCRALDGPRRAHAQDLCVVVACLELVFLVEVSCFLVVVFSSHLEAGRISENSVARTY